MSVDMVDHIVDEHHIEIESEALKRVKVSWQVKRFITVVLVHAAYIFYFLFSFKRINGRLECLIS